jgi:hypothetical protein
MEERRATIDELKERPGGGGLTFEGYGQIDEVDGEKMVVLLDFGHGE